MSGHDLDRELAAWRARYRRQALRGGAVMAFGTALCSGLLAIFGGGA